MKKDYILAINPGSTSTKIALYNQEQALFSKNIKHSSEELSQFNDIIDQYNLRKKLILEEIEKHKINPQDIKIIVGRGGLLRPIKSGIYEINEKMITDLKKGAASTKHASNLGGLIASDLTSVFKVAKAYIADPPVVDEMDDIARVTGHPMFKRKSIFHALNQKAVARRYAKEIKQPYEKLNLIIAHLGGGISVAAHQSGKIIDVNNALDGEGAFSPERSGTLPAGDLLKLCFSQKYNQTEIKKMLVGQGGLVAHLGTNNALEVEKKISQKDSKAKLIYEAMIYQVAKNIGSMYPVLNCQVNAIIITGSMAKSDYIINFLKRKIDKIAPVFIYPGENEMESLALNGYLVLSKQVTPQTY